MANPDKQSKADVIIPPNHPNPPEEHEVDAAWIVARHYNTVLEFLIPVDDYKRKTPDCALLGVLAEIKSPTGNSKKKTIGEQFERASKQGAQWLILDGRRTELRDDFLISKIKRELSRRRKIKRVVFIGKDKEVLEFH